MPSWTAAFLIDDPLARSRARFSNLPELAICCPKEISVNVIWHRCILRWRCLRW
jgi:hypothetical protein